MLTVGKGFKKGLNYQGFDKILIREKNHFVSSQTDAIKILSGKWI